ncbi:MAG: cupredoxin domain-containing protein [Thermoplasmatota archaeon]
MAPLVGAQSSAGTIVQETIEFHDGTVQTATGQTVAFYHLAPDNLGVFRVGTILHLTLEEPTNATQQHDLFFGCTTLPDGDPPNQPPCIDLGGRNWTIGPGEAKNVVVPLNQSGTFWYFSDFPGQEAGGMRGTVTVQGTPSAKTPGFDADLGVAAFAAAALLVGVAPRRQGR